jgi:hypothetical protein
MPGHEYANGGPSPRSDLSPGQVVRLQLDALRRNGELGLDEGIATAWGTLAFSGRWQSERNWIDRAGRLVGLSWIALYLACWLRN